MTAQSLSTQLRRRAPPPTALTRFVALVRAAFGTRQRVAAREREHRMLAELAELSPHVLRDIGACDATETSRHASCTSVGGRPSAVDFVFRG